MRVCRLNLLTGSGDVWQCSSIACPSPRFAIDHPFSTLPPIPASIYLNSCLSRQTLYSLAHPLPSTLLGRSNVTLWWRSVHLTSHTFSESHACVGNATLIHAVLTSHLSKGESATRREKRIEKHASGQCPYILSPIIYLYRSGRCTDQQSCTIYLTVTMTQMVEPFLCIWHTYLAIWKARKDEG